MHFLSVLSSVLHNQQHQELLRDYLLRVELQLLLHSAAAMEEQVDLAELVGVVVLVPQLVEPEDQEVMVEMVDRVGVVVAAVLEEQVDMAEMEVLEDHLRAPAVLEDMQDQVEMDQLVEVQV